jgi:hypothetical protein
MAVFLRKPLRLPSPVRGDIFVETAPNQFLSSVRSGIFRNLFLTGYENVSFVVIHVKFLQQLNVFLAE